MSKPSSSARSSTPSSADPEGQDADERDPDAGGDQDVQLQQDPPSTTGASYEGAIVVEGYKHPDFS